MNSELPQLTKRAAKEIARLVQTHSNKLKHEEYVPTIGWMISSSNPNEFAPGPCLGLHPIKGVPLNLIRESYGIRVAFNLPNDVMKRYHDHILDYLGNRFVFITRSDAAFIGGE
jgi:hypothetical protein